MDRDHQVALQALSTPQACIWRYVRGLKRWLQHQNCYVDSRVCDTGNGIGDSVSGTLPSKSVLNQYPILALGNSVASRLYGYNINAFWSLVRFKHRVLTKSYLIYFVFPSYFSISGSELSNNSQQHSSTAHAILVHRWLAFLVVGEMNSIPSLGNAYATVIPL